MQIVLISGVSGSGKSIALNVLEDAGYFAVDNLPATLLPQLTTHLFDNGHNRAAVAIDMRSGSSIAALPQQLEQMRERVDDLRMLFLNARDNTLITRFSETRRRHPLASDKVSLAEAIQEERDALEKVSALAHNIDTSNLHPNTLRCWIRDFLGLAAESGITLMFQSFGFKHGIPLDADLVFDVRCLPNPYYDKRLRPLSGRDQEVIDYLSALPEVDRMVEDIQRFVSSWLPHYANDNRSYLTVAIGCTGGQHRSVYLAERLAANFRQQLHVLVRHRSFARRPVQSETDSLPQGDR